MIRWMVVGLGNPGKQYSHTRHNVGFMVAERFGEKLDAGPAAAGWKLDKKYNAETVQVDDVLIMKPQTFMNKSGNAISQAMRFYKVPLDHLIVIHDDLDIPLGMTKMGFGKGPKIHNGLDSVERQLGNKDFWRVRIGVDNRTQELRSQISPVDYVLKQLDETEYIQLEKAFDEATHKVQEIIKNRVTLVME